MTTSYTLSGKSWSIDLMQGLITSMIRTLGFGGGMPEVLYQATLHLVGDAHHPQFEATRKIYEAYYDKGPKQVVDAVHVYALMKGLVDVYGAAGAIEHSRRIGLTWWRLPLRQFDAELRTWRLVAPDSPQSLHYHLAPTILNALKQHYAGVTPENLPDLPKEKFIYAFAALHKALPTVLSIEAPHLSATEADYEIFVPECPLCNNQQGACRLWWGIADAVVAWLRGEYDPLKLDDIELLLDTDNSYAHLVVMDFEPNTEKGCRSC